MDRHQVLIRILVVCRWDYGFREGPVFKYTFAQANVTAFEPPNNHFDHDAENLGLSQAQVNYRDVFTGVLFNMVSAATPRRDPMEGAPSSIRDR